MFKNQESEQLPRHAYNKSFVTKGELFKFFVFLWNVVNIMFLKKYYLKAEPVIWDSLFFELWDIMRFLIITTLSLIRLINREM